MLPGGPLMCGLGPRCSISSAATGHRHDHIRRVSEARLRLTTVALRPGADGVGESAVSQPRDPGALRAVLGPAGPALQHLEGI